MPYLRQKTIPNAGPLDAAPGARQAIWRNDQPDCRVGHRRRSRCRRSRAHTHVSGAERGARTLARPQLSRLISTPSSQRYARLAALYGLGSPHARTEAQKSPICADPRVPVTTRCENGNRRVRRPSTAASASEKRGKRCGRVSGTSGTLRQPLTRIPRALPVQRQRPRPPQDRQSAAAGAAEMASARGCWHQFIMAHHG
jgi:hypothetical protein